MTPPGAAAADQNATVAAGFLGWMLDAFDFFLVVMTLTAIGKEFGKSDAAIALSLTLTLLFRPVGAFIFGLLADRYGRKTPLMIDLEAEDECADRPEEERQRDRKSTRLNSSH